MEEQADTENLKVVDIAVITSLLTIKFCDTWLELLIKHTSLAIYGQKFITGQFQRYVTVLLFCKCALAMIVAFLVDAYNHKYGVALGGMGSFFVTGVFTLCMCFTHQPIFALATLAGSSLLFVATPAAFGLIFNQLQNPVRRQVRRLLSVTLFAEGLVLFVLQETVPQKEGHSGKYPMVASWAIVISLVIFILTILEKICKYVNTDNIKERGVVAILHGLRDVIKGKPPSTRVSKINTMLFVFLLLPAFSLTSMELIVSNLKPENDTQFEHPRLRRTTSLAKLTIIPVSEVLITHLPVNEVDAEMLVLGLANILNIAVMALFVLRAYMASGGAFRSAAVSNFNGDLPPTPTSLSISTSATLNFLNVGGIEQMTVPYSKRIARQLRDEASLVMVGQQATIFKNVFLVVILNPSNVPITVAEEPPLTLLNKQNTTLKSFFGLHSKHVHLARNQSQINVNLTAVPESPDDPPFSVTKNFKGKKVYFLHLQLHVHKDNAIIVAGEDIEYPALVKKPMLIVGNTFVGSAYPDFIYGAGHELQIAAANGSSVSKVELANKTKSQQLEVPEGRLVLTVRYVGDDRALKRYLKPVQRFVDLRPGSVNVVVISLNASFVSKAYDISGSIEFYRNYLPPGVAEPDAFTQTAFTMIGIVLGMSSVGYIHFFWMESPFRLRTTLFAWFLASNQIIGWTASKIIGIEIGFVEGISLLVLAIVTAIWHYALVWYRKRVRNATEPRQLTPPKIKDDTPAIEDDTPAMEDGS